MSILNARGKLLDLSRPIVMGIVNITPDSFYDGQKELTRSNIIHKIETQLRAGATIIDIGAASSRPGAKGLSAELEMERLALVADELVDRFPQAIFSIDSYQPKVVEYCLQLGWHMINDITGGRDTDALWRMAVEYQAPYVLMHMQGMPQTMQDRPTYSDVSKEILEFFITQMRQMLQLGLYDIIIDPGFGFGKSQRDNFRLMKDLSIFEVLDTALMVGVSRKAMVYRTLDISVQDALPGTLALQMYALTQGAKILRVHDVPEAVQLIRLYEKIQNSG